MSPSEFLGYKLGDHFTPHYRVVAYFEHAASMQPSRMKLFSYGKTYEGKPLHYAVVSSPENMARMADIRQNNMRLAGMVSGGAGDPNQPAVVWLSYNV
ncbi:MAG: zinc carboxypeptidase, partial [Chitinophagaceae bacterium]